MTRGRSGFTLLEIAVALAILGMGVVSVLQIFGSSLRLEERASRETRAVLAARAAMDALLVARDLTDHSEERTSSEGYRTRILVRHAGPTEGVDPNDSDFSDVGLRVLEVEVAWQDGRGSKTYSLRSMRTALEE
ncbi:MAG: type II secretion system protein [Candidatus Binatia bacterium]